MSTFTKRKEILEELAIVYGGDDAVYRIPLRREHESIPADPGYIIGMSSLDDEDATPPKYQAVDVVMPVQLEWLEVFDNDDASMERAIAKNDRAEEILDIMVEKFVCIPDKKLGGLVKGLQYTGGSVLAGNDQDRIVGAVIVLSVFYTFPSKLT